MNKYIFTFLCLAGFIALAGCKTQSPSTAAPAPVKQQQTTYVIVHGAWGGGWDWKHVDHLLTADGNTVYRPTLSGLGEHSNFNSTNIDLDTHIQDVVNVILWENLYDVVLVGHSYGGMVITGVADRIPDRIKHVVYLAASVPENGESSDTCQPARTNHFVVPIKDGFSVPPWVKANQPPPHDVPMSALCFSQPITLTNQTVAQKLPTTYIMALDAGKKPEESETYSFYQRAQARGWTVVIIQSDHNAQRSHPQEIVKLFEQAQ
jgi:pimeloyl-ACP methyl ester carboxylesterase